MNIFQIIKELNCFLAQKYNNFKGSYLYGSRAKGNASEHSDIDLVIIFDKDLRYEEQKTLAGIIGLYEYNNDVFIDYHPMTIAELQLNPVFYEEVVGRGIYFEPA